MPFQQITLQTMTLSWYFDSFDSYSQGAVLPRSAPYKLMSPNHYLQCCFTIEARLIRKKINNNKKKKIIRRIFFIQHKTFYIYIHVSVHFLWKCLTSVHSCLVHDLYSEPIPNVFHHCWCQRLFFPWATSLKTKLRKNGCKQFWS